MRTITCTSCGSSSGVRISPAPPLRGSESGLRWAAECDDCGHGWVFQDSLG